MSELDENKSEETVEEKQTNENGTDEQERK